MSKESLKKEIFNYVVAEFPAIYLYTLEESKVTKLLKELAPQNDVVNVYTYDIANGFECIEGQDKRIKQEKRAKDLSEAFDFIQKNIEQKSFIIFKDLIPVIQNNPILIREMKNILKKENKLYTIFILSSTLLIPQEIEKDIIVIDVLLPTRDEIKEILYNFIKENKLKINDSIINKFIEAFNGLTEIEILDILKLCYNENGTLTEQELINVNKHKQQQFKKNSVLEYCSDDIDKNDVGGLENVTDWLENKKKIFENLEYARNYGVDIPKGLLLFGMPGCGKSLIAKVIAKNFNMPLLKLDMGMIMGPYVGQSEENMRKAIKLAEAISPSVLWIDELEKALSGTGKSGGSSDVTTRIFGTLLTWMQEKTKPVFVVATANNVTGIPPEFMRKGRFDEIFFVEFPNASEIIKILEIHLRKRKQKVNLDGIKTEISNILKKPNKEFSGADIEAVVKELVEEKFLKQLNDKKIEDITQTQIINKMDSITPIGESMKKPIDELRAACKEFNAKDATKK